eukprot:jgi/Astpho2/2165/fgenesh1_pg.00040_%23_21_t
MPLQVKPIGAGCNQKLPSVKKDYRDIAATLDTGYNTIKQALHVDQDKLNTRFRRGELFQRVSVQRLKQLLEGGCVDMLLLDLREEDDFERWHLRGAQSYPVRMLRRAHQPFTAEMLKYRNAAPAKVIVVYDLAGSTAAAEGNLFVEKGIDNLIVLSGGIQAVLSYCPSLIEGTQVPDPAPTKPQRRRSGSSSTLAGNTSSRSVASNISRPGTGYSTVSRMTQSTQRWRG